MITGEISPVSAVSAGGVIGAGGSRFKGVAGGRSTFPVLAGAGSSGFVSSSWTGAGSAGASGLAGASGSTAGAGSGATGDDSSTAGSGASGSATTGGAGSSGAGSTTAGGAATGLMAVFFASG